MNIEVSRKWWLSIGATLGMLILLWAISAAMAQGPGPEGDVQPRGDVSIAATVNSRISYQGLLKEDGQPVTGDRNMIFHFYTNASCSSAAVQSVTKNNVEVTDGLFSVEDLDVDQDNFDGQGLWLAVEVGGTRIGCQEVLPVPYALSLRPGAKIEGPPPTASGAVLDVTVDGFYTGGKAVWGSTATGTAVRGDAAGGYGLYGHSDTHWAVVGQSDTGTGGHFSSDEGYGIRVNTDGDNIWNHAGYFTSNWGWGVFATSTHNQAIRGEAGDLSAGKTMPGGPWGVVGIGQNGGTWGSSWDNYGMYGTSHNYRGVYGNTSRMDHNYGLVTYDNLYSLNYHLAGAIMNVAQNGGSEALEPGDVVVFSGISAPLETMGSPVVQVAKAKSANSTAVAGVVYQRFNIEALAEESKADLEVTSAGPVMPGEYLLLVVQGPAQVKASALAGAIRPGDLLSSAGQVGHAAKVAEVKVEGVIMTVPGTVFGKALESLDTGQELIYVFVTLQ